jgi:intergrase/recombinase
MARGEWIFSGETVARENIARRQILPVVGERGRGWRAFSPWTCDEPAPPGVPPEVAAKILGHGDGDITRKHYILLLSAREGTNAMKKLERKVGQIMGQPKRRK